MRARRRRPMFDQLDTRLVMDGAALSATEIAIQSVDLNGILNWTLPGVPPIPPYDPLATPMPPIYVTPLITTT